MVLPGCMSSLNATQMLIGSYLFDQIILIITPIISINQITLWLLYKKHRWDLVLPISLNNNPAIAE